MYVSFTELDSRFPSGRLWRGFAPPASMGPLGSTWETPSGNPAFGFFDNFHSFQASTLEGPYLIVEGSGCTCEQIADTATEKGIVQLALDGTDNDEVVLQWGRGLGAPFKLTGKDLVFEARFALSAVTASSWDIGFGLGDVGMGVTDKFFVDTASSLATDADFLGFSHLSGDATTSHLDGSYIVASGTHIDGDVKTKLNALVQPVAATYVKAGFRYRANPATVEWYVDGVMPGGNMTPARLTASEVAASSFPDDTLLAPLFAIKSQSGTAMNVKLDWWGCAQML
jgi:hypothetical protein